MPLERYIEFKDKEEINHIDFSEDEDFKEFHKFLNSLFSSRVYKPIDIKILNNAYLA